MARARLSDESRVILAVMPQKAGLQPPTRGRPAGGARRRRTRRRDAVERHDHHARAARAHSRTRRPSPRAATARPRRHRSCSFANGVEAWLKPTDFKNDQVVFTMYAKGGASLAAPADFVQASLATQYVGLSGFGGIKPLDRNRLLAGKTASASPFISLSTHGIQGSAAPAELETALQLLYQDFTAPDNDPGVMTLIRRQLDAAVANRGQSPGPGVRREARARSTRRTTTRRSRSRPSRSPRSIAAKMFAFYRDRFSNAADFTLFMVGSFSVDTAMPLLARYVGSLPSTGQPHVRLQGRRHPLSRPPSRANAWSRDASRRRRPSSASRPTCRPMPLEQERMIAATTVVETTLRDVLREDLGQTYSVGVGLSQASPQRGDGHVQVSFGAAPQNIQAMTDRVLQEVRRLQQQGPSAGSGGQGQGSGPPRVRNVDAREQLLDGPPAAHAPHRREPDRDPDAPAAHRQHHAGRRAGDACGSTSRSIATRSSR